MSNDRKRQLFENIVRLRRAEREAPSLRDVILVRAGLEDELGETVSQRLGAELLGVSHTALRRWVDSGDVPLVFNVNGKWEVPVPALLQLRETIDHERSEGHRSRHLLEPIMREAHARADALDTNGLMPAAAPAADPHERASRRSLAYHRELARRLSQPMVDDALHTVWAWEQRGRLDPRYADLWKELLERSPADVASAIGEDGDEAHNLRQTSPFAGVLSEAERRKILTTIL